MPTERSEPAPARAVAGHVRRQHGRGGRPDLAGDALDRVRAPALLIVGGADQQVLQLNRDGAARLTAENDVTVVPGATHLFPEPGALEQVIGRSVDWLTRWLPSAPQPRSPADQVPGPTGPPRWGQCGVDAHRPVAPSSAALKSPARSPVTSMWPAARLRPPRR